MYYSLQNIKRGKLNVFLTVHRELTKH